MAVTDETIRVRISRLEDEGRNPQDLSIRFIIVPVTSGTKLRRNVVEVFHQQVQKNYPQSYDSVAQSQRLSHTNSVSKEGY